MASSSSSSTLSFPAPSLSRNWEHDVFPSFHGPDVRKSFLSHVRKEFERKAINMFIDNKIKRGKFIGPALKQAIRGSKIAIVLLSKNYASSSWCLDELVEIMNNELDQMVITIFYRVDPTDVRKQTGYFGKVFENTCQGKDKKKTETWRKALEGVGNIAGHHLSNSVDEAVMIENIAANISKMLNHLTPSRDFDHLIGMEGHMQKIEQFSCFDLEEVRMIGIWGPPGIGKTTIARFLYEQLSGSFQNRAFMVNIKQSYPKPCLDEHTAKLQLHKEMLSQMINDKDIVIPHLGVAQGRLGNRKVLLVLDDVDQLAQLDALAKNVTWFGPGSRIFITSEDLRLLWAHGIDHIYKVDFPSNDEALQMFCTYAFDQKYPKDGFEELARLITYLVGELPLGLKVMGSHFRRLTTKDEWLVEIPELRTNLNGDIESILKFSYDALSDEEKYLFLHIACFFNGEDVWKVIEYLAESFMNVGRKLGVLVEKSLISINKHYRIDMHNLLVQLGKDIVRKQSIHEAGQRQFLVGDKETCDVLNDDTLVTKTVVGIYCNSASNMTGKAFEGMTNLQYVKVASVEDHPYIISSPLTYISPKLRKLFWRSFPMKSLPLTNSLEFLVDLSMPESKLEKLWDGIKLLRSLKRINLEDSKNLKLLPNLSMAINLEELKLSNCSSLVELPSSIGNATNLKGLVLNECSSLVKLPSSIGHLTNLIGLYLRDCSSLVELPSSIGNATNLQVLILTGCSSLVELPSSIGNATNLKELSLTGCSSLVKLPSSIGNLHKLSTLHLEVCSKLKTLPIMESLYELYELGLTDCSLLESVPKISTDSLKFLDAENCESLEKLDCSFCNPDISLNFINCFKLNQEARDLIIHTSTRRHVVLPGKEVPECFTYRAYGNSVTVKLNGKPLPTSTKFKACILFNDNFDDNVVKGSYWEETEVFCCIFNSNVLICKHKRKLRPRMEHLYIFDIEAKKVTSNELVFTFHYEDGREMPDCGKIWWIKECGILQLLENHDDEESDDEKSDYEKAEYELIIKFTRMLKASEVAEKRCVKRV